MQCEIIRQLTIEDYSALEKIAYSRNNQFSENNLVKPTELSPHMKAWLAGMQKWYLGFDDKHYLFGYFNNEGILTSILGCRTDLLYPYTGVFYVGHFKTHGDYRLPTENGIYKLWNYLSNYMINNDIRQYMYMVNPKRIQTYEKFFNKADFKLITHWLSRDIGEIIPYEQPKEEWIWQIMGRNVFSTHWIIRLAERVL